MRRRSPTNARPAEDVPVRRAYMLREIYCEMNLFDKRRFPEPDSHDPHHLFGGRCGRADLVSNLLAVSRDAHDWLEANKTDGRVIALWIKAKKNELDPAEIRQASGMYLEGFLAKSVVSNEWVQPYLEELRTMFP